MSGYIWHSDTSSQHPPPPPCYQVSAHSQTVCYKNKNTAWSSNLRTLNSDFASQQMHRQLISIGGGEKKLWNGIFIRLNLLFEIFFAGRKFNKFCIFQRSRHLYMFRSLGPVRPAPHPHLPKVCRWGKVLKFLSVPWPQAENIKQKSSSWQSVKYSQNNSQPCNEL